MAAVRRRVIAAVMKSPSVVGCSVRADGAVRAHPKPPAASSRGWSWRSKSAAGSASAEVQPESYKCKSKCLVRTSFEVDSEPLGFLEPVRASDADFVRVLFFKSLVGTHRNLL